MTTDSALVAPTAKPPEKRGCTQGPDIRQVPAVDEVRKECNRDMVWTGESGGESKTPSSGDHPTALPTPH